MPRSCHAMPRRRVAARPIAGLGNLLIAPMLSRSSRLLACAPMQAACLRAQKLGTAVRVEDDGQSGVKVLTLDRPDSLNAMTVEMGDAVQASVAQLSQLPPWELRALVITGAGRAFSAGGDMRFLHERKQATPTDNAGVMLNFYRKFLSIRSLPVPIICCVNGPAIGAGACFAMAADVRFTHAAAKIGFTFVGLGLHPGMGATHSLPAAVGPQVHARTHATRQHRPPAHLAGHQPHITRWRRACSSRATYCRAPTRPPRASSPPLCPTARRP